jgi:hypothetical protein
MEISNVFREYQQTKSLVTSTQNQRVHVPLQNSVWGYVADVSDINRMTNAYNVVVPEMGNVMLRDVPRSIPGAFTQANGVGFCPMPLRPGQPVKVSFMRGGTSQPYIDDSFFINGQVSEWQNGRFPDIDTKDVTGLYIYPRPLPPEVLAVNGEAESTVYPLILRNSSPLQPQNSSTGAEVPGTRMVVDSSSNVYWYFAGQRIEAGQNEVKKVEGPRQSLADMPMHQALKDVQRAELKIAESLAYWRTAIGGRIEIQTPHPDASRQGVLSSSNSPSLTTGLSPSQLPGADAVGNILNTVNSALQGLTKASKEAGLQLNFLKSLKTAVAVIEAVWGTYNKFGCVQVGIQLNLPANLSISLSISFDFSTGRLSISGSLSSGSIVQTPSTPLTGEGNIISGGVLAQVDSTIQRRYYEVDTWEQMTIYTSYPELTASSSDPLSPPVVYKPIVNHPLPALMASTSSNFNFSSAPEQALLSLLVRLGVPQSKAVQITTNLNDLLSDGSILSFIKLAAATGTKAQSVAVTLQLLKLGAIDGSTPDEKFTSATQLAQLAVKPSVLQCPPVPSPVLTTLQEAIADPTSPVVSSYLSNLSMSVPDDATNWVDIAAFLAWLESVQHPFYPALNVLSQGRTLDALVLFVFLSTGLDVRAYIQTYDILKQTLVQMSPLLHD